MAGQVLAAAKQLTWLLDATAGIGQAFRFAGRIYP